MRRGALVSAIAATALLALLTGCGGGGGGSGGQPFTCSKQDYNKTGLPALPPIHTLAANPLYYQQWAIHYDRGFYVANGISDEASIHMDGDHRFLGRHIKVAVIDDGLDVHHPDLQGRVVATYDVESGTTDVTPPRDEDNHGTEVSGVIAADNNDIGPVGVAPDVDLYFIRLPFNQNISTSQIVEAFQKAREWGVDVVNCSWGSGDVSDSVRSAIVDLARSGRNGKGTVIVFAAGNEDQYIGNDESSIPEVIAVGATDRDNLRTYYSNYGSSLDIMAPGGEYSGEYIGITTLDQSGRAGESSGDYLVYDDDNAFAGTSAAAPIVTGVVAQLLEANPNLTREDVYNAVTCNADKIGGIRYDNQGFNIYYGYGKINASRSLDAVR
ncbi:S8 family serine peptidase [Hydrogenimonas sp. SS33]|uniref:S8 family serine peptidase n=1 Tax=Hydrogenimonas leucolamina TaxID=2954236 RepID=UPI00336C1783